jgi:hypothetical protein
VEEIHGFHIVIINFQGGLGKTVAIPRVGRCCRNAGGAAAPPYQD